MRLVRLVIRSGAQDEEEQLREIMGSLRRLVAVLAQSARAVEQRTGVTNAQLFVLQQLADGRALSISDIASLALTHQSAASLVVSRLEREGLVSRTRSAQDARRAEVSLTARGQRVVETAPPPPTARLLSALRSLPNSERHRLGVSLVRLSAALGIGDAEPMMLFEPPVRARTTVSRGAVTPRKRGARRS
jgi:DNA-binding MarR family transcriptional regulator